jgi:hypothetical protein
MIIIMNSNKYITNIKNNNNNNNNKKKINDTNNIQ